MMVVVRARVLDRILAVACLNAGTTPEALLLVSLIRPESMEQVLRVRR